MLKKNVGTLDRILRAALGLALLAAWFLFPDAPYRWAFLIGVVPLATALMSTCPVYTLLGMSTCPVKRA